MSGFVFGSGGFAFNFAGRAPSEKRTAGFGFGAGFGAKGAPAEERTIDLNEYSIEQPKRR